MDNQHRQIKGYSELTAADIAVMNEVKAHADATAALIARVHAHNVERFGASSLRSIRTADEAVQVAESNRWAAVAKTQLQQGFMALNRAVALPTTF